MAAEGTVLGKGSCRIKVLHDALWVIAPEPGVGAEKPKEETVKETVEPVSPVTK